MKILVTGGTGVIGAAAIPALLEAGHEIRLLSRHAAEDVARFPRRVEPFTADVGQAENLREAVQGCACVVHIAGIVEEQPPEITFEKVNAEGTRALCAAAEAAGQPYFIHISSLGADRGQSEYHRSKLHAEQHVRRYAGPWLILRPGNVYGPGDETVSMLLKMVRNLPAVPMVEAGDQPFQPLWYADLGAALAQAVERCELAGRTMELAGPEVTTTSELFDRLAELTGRNPPRLPVPAWLAQFGTDATESGGGLLSRAFRTAGFELPINPAKLQMLLEGSVIPETGDNALVSAFGIPPTQLPAGLEQLADLVPEQLPGDGVGAVERSTYFADIVHCAYSPERLLSLVLDRITEIMPIEFAAEPGAPTKPELGVTMTGSLPGRGHFQVRLDELTETRATFITIEGHPLTGVLTFTTKPSGDGVRFSIELVAQSSNALDWLALWGGGRLLQSQNWRSVVRRVVELSGGSAPEGVQKRMEKLSEQEIAEFTASARDLIARRQRTETEQSLGSRALPR